MTRLAAAALAATMFVTLTFPAPGFAWGAGACAIGPVGPQVFAQGFNEQSASWQTILNRQAAARAAQTAPPSRPDYAWEPCRDGDARYLMLRDRTDGVQHGALRIADGAYLPLLADGSFGPACEPPIDRPPPGRPGPAPVPTPAPTAEPNYGVAKEKISTEERYTVDGQPAAAADAARALGAPVVPDDAAKPSLTAIGSPEDCAAAKAQLARTPGLLESVLWQDYRPSDVMVQHYGFVTSGKPSMYLQAPDGQVLYHEDAAGPAELGRLVQAVRKADPNYDPKRDPNGVPPPAPDPLAGLVAWVQTWPAWAWAVVAGVAVFLLTRKRA